MQDMQSLIIELDRLKSVLRKSYISDGTRYENTAEHSWHLAITLLALKLQMPQEIDIDRAIRIALVHDVCEIGAGDICAYDPNRSDNTEEEARYLTELAEKHGPFGSETLDLWSEYEAQTTLESRWVKIVDKLLPFLLNLASDGKTWHEQSICRSMVIAHNRFIENEAPDLHAWMIQEIDKAVKKGWLEDA